MSEPTPQPQAQPPAPQDPPSRADATSMVTNLIRLGGLAVVFKGVFLAPAGTQLDTRALAIAAFMMAGAQLTDTLLNAFLGKK
jgi:hypothetical protein